MGERSACESNLPGRSHHRLKKKVAVKARRQTAITRPRERSSASSKANTAAAISLLALHQHVVHNISDHHSSTASSTGSVGDHESTTSSSSDFEESSPRINKDVASLRSISSAGTIKLLRAMPLTRPLGFPSSVPKSSSCSQDGLPRGKPMPPPPSLAKHLVHMTRPIKIAWQ